MVVKSFTLPTRALTAHEGLPRKVVDTNLSAGNFMKYTKVAKNVHTR